MSETRPLSHADQAERSIGAHRLLVKADSVVGDGEAKIEHALAGKKRTAGEMKD